MSGGAAAPSWIFQFFPWVPGWLNRQVLIPRVFVGEYLLCGAVMDDLAHVENHRRSALPIPAVPRRRRAIRRKTVPLSVTKIPARFHEQPFVCAIMLACDAIHADRTVYADGCMFPREN